MTMMIPSARMRASALALLLVLLALPTLASAQDIHAEPPPIRATESPVFGLFELRFGSYKPNIDKEFGGSGPYASMFGGGNLLFELGLHWHLYDGVGKVSLAGSIGYWNKKANAFNADGTQSADRTRLMMVPMRGSVVYRFDYLQERFRVPFVLSAKAGLDYYFWNVYSAGKVADGAAGDDVFVGRGGTAGWHYGVTLYFWLNFLAPSMSAAFDSTTGINNTYLFAEFLSTRVGNFGSKKSWELGDNTFLFGLAFEF